MKFNYLTSTEKNLLIRYLNTIGLRIEGLGNDLINTQLNNGTRINVAVD